jgi:hypothetical protein
VTLALVQAWLCLGAIVAAEVGSDALAIVALAAGICGLVAGGVLDSFPWRPARPATPRPEPTPRSGTRYETAAPSSKSG